MPSINVNNKYSYSFGNSNVPNLDNNTGSFNSYYGYNPTFFGYNPYRWSPYRASINNFNINNYSSENPPKLNYDIKRAKYPFENNYTFQNPYSDLDTSSKFPVNTDQIDAGDKDKDNGNVSDFGSFSSGMPFGMIRQVANNIMGGAVNQTYDYLDSPYAQQVKDFYDATQDPIARAVKNWTGKGRDNILESIREDRPDESLFNVSIAGTDNSSILNNFGYKPHSNEELGIRQYIKQKDFFAGLGDLSNQAGVGALYGAEIAGGYGALAGLATGLIAGTNNLIYDSKNTKRFNDAINQNNMLKRMRESAYKNNYLAQYSDQVEDIADTNYRNNLRNYYGILRDGGSIRNSYKQFINNRKLDTIFEDKVYFKNGGIIEGTFDVNNITREEINELNRRGFKVNIL